MVIINDYQTLIGFFFGVTTTILFFILYYLYRSKYKPAPAIPLEQIIAALPGHVYWLNCENIYLGCNENQAKSVGLTAPTEIIGKRNRDFPQGVLLGGLPEKLDGINQIVMSTGEAIILEEPALSTQGKELLFLSNKAPLFNKTGEVIGVLGVSIDITEHSQKNMADYFQEIIRIMPGHVYWKDKQGVYLGSNESHAKTAGFSSVTELIGKTDFDTAWKSAANEVRKNDAEIISSGSSQTVEEKAILPNGTEAIFLSKKSPLYHKGKIMGILGISFDITEQKKIEKELIDTKARLDGMTLLGASIAHELRTPFANLNITTQTIEKKINAIENDEQHIKSDLHSVKKEIKAALTFIDMLLLNINPTINEAKITDFSMKECIDHTLERYPFVGKQHELIQWNEKKSPDFIVRGEELLLIHLFFNLIKNSLYYIAKARKGNIEIWIENRTVFFKDTGTGIKPEHLPHIFKHFFSQTYHGAGVGLTFCKWVMDNLNGKITCESDEGHYTLFTLEFPNNT